MEERLLRTSRFSVGIGVMLTVAALYGLGPVSWLVGVLPLLSVLPTWLFLSELIRRLVEWRLGRRRVAVGDDAVFITGCDSGFGNLLARRLADRGYEVFAGCQRPDDANVEDLRLYSSRICVVPIDVTSCESVQRAKDTILQKLNGRNLWAVVANAGIAQQGPLEWTSMSEIEAVFNVNVFGVVRTLKAFLPLIRKSKGRVVVTSSLLATISNPCVLHYSMSKAAIKNLVEGLQRELQPFGVYCSSVEPNYYATNILKVRTMDDYQEKYEALDPELKKDYAGYMAMCKRYYRTTMNVLTSNKLEEPLSAFEHAVCSVRPRPYYTVDSALFCVCREVLKHLNVEVTDAIVYVTQYLGGLTKRFRGETNADDGHLH